MTENKAHKKVDVGFIDSTLLEYKEKPQQISIKITSVYLIIGVLWILLSDKLLTLLVNDKVMITNISMVKGWFYVLTSGLLIYFLIYSSLKRVKSTEEELFNSCRNLKSANDELEAAYGQLQAFQQTLKCQYDQILESQQRLRESEERYRLISEATNDAIWEEIEGIRIFSDRWFEITGYEKDDPRCKEKWEELIHPEDKAAVQEAIFDHVKNKTPFYKCNYRLMTSIGDYKWIHARGKAIFDEQGLISRMAGSHTDITELKEYEDKLCYLAYHDTLTSLRNRAALADKLSMFSMKEKSNIAIFFVNIDNFKNINDTSGYVFGDNLLVKVSERLVELEENNCSTYRLSGDEFIVVMEGFYDVQEVERYAVKILKEFKKCFYIEGSSVFISLSIGIAFFPEHGQDLDSLLKKADIAMNMAKHSGRNRIVFYNEPMKEVLIEKMIIEKELRTALDNDEFELYYQPQLDVRSNIISGFEALIRWNNQRLGSVSPLRFIGIAEETHLINPIGEWVLKNACLFIKRIHQMGYADCTVSVNVSILQLLQDDFVDNVLDALRSARLDPKALELEITESILMESYEKIADKLKLLRSKGVKIALDDFGKGYSSLNYLKQLPISTLKVDKSFVETISVSKKNESLAGLIVEIGAIMDLCVIAEGVETIEQMEYLKTHNCDKIQGYLLSKPIPEQDAEKMLRLNQTLYIQKL